MHSPSPKTDSALMETTVRALPYLVSWAALAILMIIGMDRMPLVLYTPIDGQWARWNVEAILQFGKVFDLSAHSMLAGMGSMYFPNLPWLNPGALALALPLGDQAKSIASYAIYAAELAVSIVVLARVIGFSWLMATAAAQLYLYLLFPPFSEVFRIYDWYSVAPYYAHLQAVLNGAAAALLVCGRLRDWRANAMLAAGFFVLFISGLLSAPFTFVFAAPAYVVICAALILTRQPSRSEWAWKSAALVLCLIFFFASGLLDYYLGTIATAGRTPTAAIAWDRLLSADAWLRLFRDHALCGDPRLMLCIEHRWAWLQIAALCGAALAIIRRCGGMRTADWTLVAYVGLVHVYAYAYQVDWLGPVSVLSSHFLILSCWSFICMYAVVPFFELACVIKENAYAAPGRFAHRRVARVLASTALAALLVAIVVSMLHHPYDIQRFRMAQFLVAVGAVGAVALAIALAQPYRAVHGIGSTVRDASLRSTCRTTHRSKSENRFAAMQPRFGSTRVARSGPVSIRRASISMPDISMPRSIFFATRRNLHGNRFVAGEHSDLRRVWGVDFSSGAPLCSAAACTRRNQGPFQLLAGVYDRC
jgi:hypothetical protein